MFTADIERQAAVFDAIGERYDEVFANKDAQVEATQWLVERLRPGACVLDAGCGTGHPTAKMLADAGCDVLGVDISETMLELARGNVPGARFERMDMACLTTVTGPFDAITAFFSLLMLPRARIETLLREWAGLVRTGGYIVLSMVEADLDYVEIPFIGQTPRLSGYPRDRLAEVLQDAGLHILESRAIAFPPATPDAPPETQLFYCCGLR
jgi:ubiquinone/menaquinone biosynthesis C-methylase UbiE